MIDFELVAFLFPLFGMFPSTIAVYFNEILTIKLEQPFATYTNVCYMTGAVGLFLLPCFSGNSNPYETSVTEILLLLLGVASFVFHSHDSPSDSWPSVLDRLNMYVLLVFLSLHVFAGVISTYLKRPLRDNSIAKIIILVLQSTLIILVFFYQQYIDANFLFLITGTLIFIGNCTTRWLYGMQRNFSKFDILIGIATQSFLMLSAFLMLRHADIHPNSYDFSHGCWHILTSIVVSTIIVTVYKGITNVDTTERERHILILMKWFLGIIMIALSFSSSNTLVNSTFLLSYVLIAIIITSFMLIDSYKSSEAIKIFIT